jgi:hypothetical protein
LQILSRVAAKESLFENGIPFLPLWENSRLKNGADRSVRRVIIGIGPFVGAENTKVL